MLAKDMASTLRNLAYQVVCKVSTVKEAVQAAEQAKPLTVPKAKQ